MMNSFGKLNYLYDEAKNIISTTSRLKSLFFFGILSILFASCTANDVDFDYLIFSQRWLPSSCIAYQEHKPNSGDIKCVLPDNYDIWAIHGLWPTQNKHMGPFFCNSKLHFNESQLTPILSELKSKWMNIEGGKSAKSLWKHEWLKHGTCFAELFPENSELIYFNTTLNFYNTHNILRILSENGIISSNDIHYSALNIFDIIRNAFGKTPYIDCVTEVKTNQSILAEIRLCYSKNLELIDCEPVEDSFHKDVKHSRKFTNCPLDSPVMIPTRTDIFKTDIEFMTEKLHKIYVYNKLIKIINMLRFLIWATI